MDRKRFVRFFFFAGREMLRQLRYGGFDAASEVCLCLGIKVFRRGGVHLRMSPLRGEVFLLQAGVSQGGLHALSGCNNKRGRRYRRPLEELLTRIELVTSSLPRKCSTTELQQQHLYFQSGTKVYIIFRICKLSATEVGFFIAIAVPGLLPAAGQPYAARTASLRRPVVFRVFAVINTSEKS